jgi:hypothetical protein
VAWTVAPIFNPGESFYYLEIQMPIYQYELVVPDTGRVIATAFTMRTVRQWLRLEFVFIRTVVLRKNLFTGDLIVL